MKYPAKIDIAVLLLFFNRTDTFQQVFEAVHKARPSKLFLYQDGPRGEQDNQGIEACREIVSDENIDWECEVHRLYQDKNLGCDPSEYISQKWAFSIVDKCIVLEDDDVPTQSFFPFCKEMLDRYEYDERIMMISGFNIDEITPDCPYDYFFTSTFAIWGWASWRRVIDQWDGLYSFLDDDYNMSQLHALAKQRGYNSDMIQIMKRHRQTGKEYYETIFRAAILFNSGLAIMPTKNQINNLGLTTNSTHYAASAETTPHKLRRIFTMRRHELTFPLRHPRYVIENVDYKERLYRVNAWEHPLIKISYSLEELLLNIYHGNFKYIWQSVLRRIRKLIKI